MKFSGVCLITPNLKRMQDFYQAVLQVTTEEEPGVVSFSTAGLELAIFAAQGMDTFAPGSMEGAGYGSFTLDFEVEDVDREYQRLKNMNVTVLKQPETHPWGRRSFWFRDPDGNIVNFYANVTNFEKG